MPFLCYIQLYIFYGIIIYTDFSFNSLMGPYTVNAFIYTNLQNWRLTQVLIEMSYTMKLWQQFTLQF